MFERKTGINSRLQSAMEYLMTYGWAILIIAVVLGALFQLGIFNASTFTPKAPPGACHVFRPNGPGTTSFINLQGICNGELPQYVWRQQGAASYANVPDKSMLGPTQITISVWLESTTKNWKEFMQKQSYSNNGIWFGTDSGGNPYFYSWTSKTLRNACDNSHSVSDGSWHNVAVTYNGFAVTTYDNGKQICQYNYGTYLPLGYQIGTALTIGAYGDFSWSGLYSNFQIYNSSLSANEIVALYNEGIGGAPVQLNNLVGWWPLNGDTKDYSGNGNNGVSSAVTFTSEWASTYSAP